MQEAEAAGEGEELVEGSVDEELAMESREERWLRMAKTRTNALMEIYQLARQPPHREALWADAEVRERLLERAGPPDQARKENPFAQQVEDSGADERSVSLSALAHLVECPANKSAMAADYRLRRLFVLGAASEEPLEVRSKALAGLAEIALAGACANGWDEPESPPGDEVPEEHSGATDADVCAAMVQAAAPGQPVRHRVMVLGCFWSLLVLPGGCRAGSMWGHKGFREALLAAATDEQVQVRGNAIGVAWALAAQRQLDSADDAGPEPSEEPSADVAHVASLREVLWRDGRLREALLGAAAAAEGHPPELRKRAFQGMATLAEVASNRLLMWGEQRLTKPLITAARGNDLVPGTARHLAASKSPRESRRGPSRDRPVVLDRKGLASKSKEAAGPGMTKELEMRVAALRLLRQLARQEENRPGMASKGVPQLLSAASEDASLGHAEQCACLHARTRILVSVAAPLV